MKKELQEKINALLKKVNLKAVSADGKVTLSEEKPVEMIAKGSIAEGIEIMSPSDTFDVGSEVFVMDADGNPTPAPDGEHIIDGTLKITVSGGKITETETVEMKQELSAEVEAVITALTDRIADLESKVNASATELSAVKTNLSAAEAKATEAEKRVKELEKAPGATSVKEKLGKQAAPKAEAPKKHWNAMTTKERIENPELNPRFQHN